MEFIGLRRLPESHKDEMENCLLLFQVRNPVAVRTKKSFLGLWNFRVKGLMFNPREGKATIRVEMMTRE